MARQIFIVSAQIVDANGTFHFLDGYPKTFDSKNYNDDVEKAQIRADGDASDVWSKMSLVDTRQVQTVTLSTIYGYQFYNKTRGKLAENQGNEPEE